MPFQRAPYPVDAEQTGVTLAYTNRRHIADFVLPRSGVGQEEFKWIEKTRSDLFTVPETLVGRKGRPNEVEFTGTEKSSFTQDFGLDDVVPNSDIAKAQNVPNWNPITDATLGLTELLAVDREKRVADLVFGQSTYAASNRTALSGTSQWSDYTNSDPYSAIMTALDGMVVRPNIGVIGRLAWSKLRVHPKVTAAIAPSATGNTPTANAAGAPASAQAIADLLELDAIYVGESFMNTAKPGQTASLSRVWGKHMAFLHQNPIATVRGNAITFGLTAEYGNRVSWVLDEQVTGLRGAQRVRVGESLRELVCAADVGYLFQTVVA